MYTHVCTQVHTHAQCRTYTHISDYSRIFTIYYATHTCVADKSFALWHDYQLRSCSLDLPLPPMYIHWVLIHVCELTMDL